MKKKPTDPGQNKTQSPNGAFSAAHTRVLQHYQPDLEPVGTMPPPTRLKGVVTTAKDLLTGRKTTVLLDKLGERMAFERTATRLYDLLLAKLDLQSGWDGGPTRTELLEIREDEHQHFKILADTLKKLGADPTVVTPGADLAAVESVGIHNVVADPRTTVGQALHAILVAELTDNAGWELLIDLAEGMGQDELAARFTIALSTEEEHLAKVRRWLRAEIRTEAGAPTASPI